MLFNTLLYIPTVISPIENKLSPIAPISISGIWFVSSSIHCLNNNLVCTNISVFLFALVIKLHATYVLPHPQGP